MQRGFTLIEMMVVAALILIVAAVSSQGFSLFQRRSDLNASADTIVAILEEARSKTLSSKDQSQYGVRFNLDRVLLFSGSSLPVDVGTLPSATSTAGFREYVLSGTVGIPPPISFSGSKDVIFKRLTGETAQTGSVTLELKSDTSQIKIITIQSTGIISLQ